MAIMDGFIRITGDWDTRQYLREKLIGTYTFAVCAKVNVAGEYIQTIEVFENDSSIASSMCTGVGEWKIYTCTATFTGVVNPMVIINNRAGSVSDASMDVQWAALYEGTYTAETLPSYVPKGKHVEMLNCGVSLAPHNLLDNSDFRNPVAQAGIGGSHGSTKYVCDRWWDRYGFGEYSLNEGVGITLSYGTNHCYCTQRINNASQYHGKVMTLAAKLSDGTIYVKSGAYLSSETSFRIGGNNWLFDLQPNGVELVVMSGSITIVWAALYEGAYDASTLPAYQPKGYAAELAECMMFQREGVVVPVSKIKDALFLIGPVIQMRDMGGLKPTITLKKFTRPGVIDVTSFNASDRIDIENLGGGRYLLMNAILVSCMDYASGHLRFSVNADI